jgi:hypothetical protein
VQSSAGVQGYLSRLANPPDHQTNLALLASLYSEDAGFYARLELDTALEEREHVPSDGLCFYHVIMFEYTGLFSFASALALRAIVHKLLLYPQSQQLYGHHCMDNQGWEHYMGELAKPPEYTESGNFTVQWADALVIQVVRDITNRPIIILERPPSQTDFIISDEAMFGLVEVAALGLRPVVCSLEGNTHYNRIRSPECFATADVPAGCSPLPGTVGRVVGFYALCFA